MKILINVCYGGFSVSEKLHEELGIAYDGYGYLGNDIFGIKSDNYDAFRAHPDLILAVEKLGIRLASGDNCADLRILEIPDGVDWRIDGCDGKEWVFEVYRTWHP